MRLALAAALLIAAPAAAQTPSTDAAATRAGTYAVDKGHAKILWSVSHFGFSTYSGEFTDFDAALTLDPKTPASSRLDVTIRMAGVETNDDKLDAHLKTADFFDAAKFPTATFRSTKVSPTGPTSATVSGDFTLKGVTRPLTLAVTFNGAGANPMAKTYVAGFDATGTIRRSDHGVSYGVPMVGDAVALRISAEFNPK